MKKALILLFAVMVLQINDAAGQYTKGKLHQGFQGNITHWSLTSNEWILNSSSIYYLTDNLGIGLKAKYRARNIFSGKGVYAFQLEHVVRYHIPGIRNFYLSPGIGVTLFGGSIKYLIGGVGLLIPLSQKIMFDVSLNLILPLRKDIVFGSSTSTESILGLIYIIN